MLPKYQILVKILFFLSVLYPQAFNGLTLFSVYSDDLQEDDHYTRLIDNDENIIHTWSHDRGAASMPYLLTDSTLLYPYRVQEPSMFNGGVGGGISYYAWNGDLLWSYEFANNSYQHHHDIHPLPNGNILVLLWERHTASQGENTEFYGGPGKGWAQMGRTEVQNPLNQMWSEAIFEIEMVGNNDINIIWEWHVWDHTVQDIDAELDNYGEIAEHPELMNINFGEVGDDSPTESHADWIHFNAIDYNKELDQIALSSRHNSEIYIIDHSTTTEEAAGHSGGGSNRGGDIIYRWGNPQAYGQGDFSDQKLDSQHGVNWIPEGYPGEGNLLLFNNFYNQDWNSAVYELILPLNGDGIYDMNLEGTYEPEGPVWMISGGFFSWIQSGAFRLPNGNTLITVATAARIFEVEENLNIVWDYDFDGGQMIARAQKYPMDYLFPDYNLGDVNFDNVITVADLLLVSDMVSGFGYAPTPPADLNEDGSVNISDMNLLIQSIINYQ